LTFSCQRSDKSNKNSIKTELEVIEINSSKGQFISIDSVNFEKYPHMQELKAWVKNTTTKSNWRIEYLVKTDSTIDKDIYIRISNSNFENIFKGEHLLEFRRYFIPTYLSETEKDIVFEHGCATDCSALTLISKNDSTLVERYSHVIDFNEERKILLHISDSTYSYEDKMFQIESVDLKSEPTCIMFLSHEYTKRIY